MYSDVEGDDVWPGDGNISEDPGFLDDDLHISENSPCEDMGTEDYHFADSWYYAPEFDFEGTPRPYDDEFDIGADECNVISRLPDLSSDDSSPVMIRIYPNPAFSRSNIKYQISKSKSVVMNVLDIRGSEISTLVNEDQAPGEHTVSFDTSGLSAGIYLVRLEAGEAITTTKFVVMR